MVDDQPTNCQFLMGISIGNPQLVMDHEVGKGFRGGSLGGGALPDYPRGGGGQPPWRCLINTVSRTTIRCKVMEAFVHAMIAIGPYVSIRS